jgi:acyl transferase domain-containing protein/acyl carrier protein
MSDTSPPGGLTAEKQALLALRKMRARIDELERARTEPIAIIGAGCRLPGGVTSPEAFWGLLRAGTDAVADVPRERWDIEAYYDADPDAPGKMYTRRGGFLDAIDGFDPRHFAITPREAISMDPQQRLLLEVTWEALERAGVAPDRLTGSDTGVFVGISTNDYGQILLRASDQIDPGMYFGTGNLLNAAAGRLSYVLGLQGPSMAIDTACSSSLVAIHLACQSLRNRECRMALAGGANLVLVPEVTVNCCRAKMLAPDGRCKTFDAAADGYVRGEGAAVIVLKRLSDALADGDSIVALIRGSAVNQDGRSGGFTAPNELAQQSVIRNALSAAGVAAADIGYVEAHGTGTSLGDPIEIHAITAALGEGRARPLVVGSVKTNLGHLEAAAGVTGLLKVALALQHGEIPPHLHFQQLNPHIDVGGFPLEIPRGGKAWPRTAERRLAGVSSFGFTGTNAHAILEEAPPPAEREAVADRPAHVLALSARTDAALIELADRYAAYLSDAPAPLGDVCATAAQGRAVFDHRLAVVASAPDEARERLREFASGSAARVHAAKVRTRDEGVVFLFTGQGAQYAGMGKGLYDSEAVFRAAVDRCAEILRDTLDRPLQSVLFPAPGEASPIDDTQYAQPAIFAIEYALSELWRSWGVQPSAVLGHSIGEFAAAVVAGVMTVEDALRLVAARGRLMQQLPGGGAMAAVIADEARVTEAIASFADRVSIAALNGPANTVISGSGDAIAQILDACAAKQISAQRLVVSHAFHSPLMEPMLDEFERIAAAIRYAPPRVPFVSTVTGTVSDGSFAFDASYWRRHARGTVRFADGLTALQARGDRVFLEIGPAPTLSGMGRRLLEADDLTWLASLRKGRDDWRQMLDAVGGLFVQGVALDWSAFDAPYRRRKALLPTYPFQRERYWVEVAPAAPPSTSAPAGPGGPETYGIEWIARDADARADVAVEPARYVVAGADTPWRAAIAGELARAGHTCAFVGVDGERPDVRAVLAAASGARAIVVLASETTCELLMALAPQLERQDGVPARIVLVTRGTQPVDGTTPAIADAPAWGFGRVLALEHASVWGAAIDVADSGTEDAVCVARELAAFGPDDQVVFRKGVRYVPRLDRLATVGSAQLNLSGDATYLITGGLGSLGLALAERLVARGARSIALAGRRGLPARAEWDAIHPSSELGRQIAVVRRLEAAGATIHVCRADIADAADVARLFAALPAVRGVIHAAGVSRATAIADMTPEILGDTLRPKLAGGWLLHEATRRLPLDFFVLFSSISSIWGSRTLAAYAAANQALDALAHHRRGLGLPATSINWGPWAEGGMVDEGGQKWLSAMGVEALKPALALDVLERVVAARHTQVVVAAMDWEKFLAVYEARGERPFMDRVRPARTAAAATPADRRFVERLERMLPFERREAIARAIAGHVAAVIGGGGAASIGMDEGLFELGMDSLMATELRRRIERQFDRALTPTLTFDYPTVAALAAHVDEECFGASTPTTAAPVPFTLAPDASADLASAIAALESLSEDAVEAMLSTRATPR